MKGEVYRALVGMAISGALGACTAHREPNSTPAERTQIGASRADQKQASREYIYSEPASHTFPILIYHGRNINGRVEIQVRDAHSAYVYLTVRSLEHGESEISGIAAHRGNKLVLADAAPGSPPCTLTVRARDRRGTTIRVSERHCSQLHGDGGRFNEVFVRVN